MENNACSLLHEAIKDENIKQILALLSVGVDVNEREKNYSENTPLHLAIEVGNVKILKLLLNAGAKVNSKNNWDRTPLGYALVDNYKVELLKTLVDAGADVNETGDFGQSALHFATSANDVELIEYLLSWHVNVNIKNANHGQTPLHIAGIENVGNSHQRTMEILLENGAEVDTRDNAGKTPLYYLVGRADSKTVQLLLNFKADVQIADGHGSIPLFHAVGSNNFDAVQLLMIYGSDIKNVNPRSGSTPLHEAAHHNHVESHLKILSILLKNGAKVNAQDHCGRTALHSLAKNANLKTIKLLLDYKADVSVQDNQGQIPLFNAVAREDYEIVRLLIDHGSDVNNFNSTTKTTLLHEAALQNHLDGHLKVIEVLLKRGADVNAQDQDGMTPLQCLVKEGNSKIINLLLSFNADVNLKDNSGEIPLVKAIKFKKHIDIVNLLIDHGSDVNTIDVKTGKTPLHEVCERIGVFNEKLIKNFKIIKSLIKNGASVHVVDNCGNAPLKHILTSVRDYLSNKQLTELLRLLLKYADVNTNNLNDKNIFEIINTNYHWEMILEHFAKLKALDIKLHDNILDTIACD